MKAAIHKACALLLLLCASFITTAQIASFHFNQTLEDQSNNHDAVYLIDGVASANNPIYLEENGETRLFLGPNEGISFPSSLNAVADTSASLEIAFTFSITEIGDGRGFKHLWSATLGANDPGFYLLTRHDEFSSNDDYELIFSYSDGGFNAGVPNHAGHDETVIGTQFQGDVVEVRIIFDFAQKTWSSLVNGNFTSKPFNNEFNYDWDIMMEAIKDNTWFFGWYPFQAADMDFEDDVYTSSIFVDNLEIFSPRQEGNANIVMNALQALTAHILGTTPLSIEERTTFLNEVLLNYFDNHDLVSEDVFNYINAYEATFPPIYENRESIPVTGLSIEGQLLLFLQQSLFDNELSLDNVASFEGVHFEFADIFPGPVSESATRVTNAIVEIDATHSYNPAARTVDDLGFAKRPTGHYAAPGELVTITIPNEAIDAGLSVMIGAQDADHSSLSVTNRPKRISKTFAMSGASTTIVSPFGGGIYILVPLNANLGWIDVSISGAVASPYFSWRTDRHSDPAVWATQLQEHAVEWVDLESDKYMMTLPVNHMLERNILDPTSLMTQWDSIIVGGFDYIGGRPEDSRKRSEYFSVDSRLPNNVFGVGYPQAMGDDLAPFGPFDGTELYPTQILQPNFWNSGLEITFHEMGHAALLPTLPDEVESIVHLHATYVYNHYYGLSIDEAYKFSSGERFVLNEAAIDWMIMANFRNNDDMGCSPEMDELVCDEYRYQHRGWAKYINMAKLHGWSTVHTMNRVFYDDWSENEPYANFSKDDLLRAASVSNNINMAPLFHFWGHAPSAELSAELAALPSSNEILNQLIEYYNIIPQDQSAFEPWRDLLLERKDPVHHDRINNAYALYDSEDFAQQMRNQICNIIEIYFPNSTFCDLVSVIEQNEDNNAFEIFPNPTHDFVTIQGEFSKNSITLHSANGGIIGRFTANGNAVKIDLSEFAKGIYFIEISDASGLVIERKKLVKS